MRKLLSNPEVKALETELNSLLAFFAYVDATEEASKRADEILDILENGYHTGLEQELRVIQGGKL